MPSLKEIEEDVESVQETQQTIENVYKEYMKAQRAAEASGDKLAALLKDQKKELAHLKRVARTAHKCGDIDEPKNDEIEVMCDKFGHQLAEHKKSLPADSNPIPVRMILGSMNVNLVSHKSRQAFKREYEEFKLRWTIVALVINLISLLWPNRWLLECFHLLLMYFYSTLTLRESILVTNGSNIKGWWIVHHYLSILVTVTLLTWPSTESYQQFLVPFLSYAMYTSMVQIMQYRYQTARLYQLRALEKAKSMDVANAETGQFHWSRSMAFLLPFVFLGQFIQLYLSYFLATLAWTSDSEIQVPILSFFFLVLGLGNLITTILVLFHKWRKSRRLARLEKVSKSS